MLLALWAFSRSSRRFHDWLFHHRIFGAPLRRWQRERILPRWVKAIAFTSMAASMTYVAAVVRPPWYALLVMAAAVAGGVCSSRGSRADPPVRLASTCRRAPPDGAGLGPHLALSMLSRGG